MAMTRSLPGGTRMRPMFEQDHQEGCSVLLGRLRNEACLLALPEREAFLWLHRFFVVVDTIVGKHKVYKLYGGPQGFMISAGVAEPDPQHAATLLHVAAELHAAIRQMRFPDADLTPVECVLALASGPATSGMLGTTSLTYQVVGRCVAVARELADTVEDSPVVVAASMRAALPPAVAAALVPLGSVPLRCCPGEPEELWSLPGLYPARLAPPSPTAAPPKSLSKSPRAADTAGAAC